MSTWHTVSIAALILGLSGTGSALVIRVAVHQGGPVRVPARLRARLLWWTAHLPAVLWISLAMVLLGCAGLFTS